MGEDVSFNLLCNSVLVAFFVIFCYFNANYLRKLTFTMADSLAPQTPTKTPTKKLFKPSSKTKTTTPVNRRDSTNTTPHSAQSTTSPAWGGSLERRRFPEKTLGLTPRSPFQPFESSSNAIPEDIAKSTVLTPLTSSSYITPGKIPNYATSNATDDTPIGLVDHDIFTPSDTVSRSTEAPHSLSRGVSGTLKHATSGTEEKTDQLGRNTEEAAHVPNEEAPDQKRGLEKSSKTTDSADDRLTGSEGAQTPLKLAGALKSPTDIAHYFADSGNQEMSNFVKALASSASQDATTKAGDITADLKATIPDTLEEFPTDDNLVVESNDRTKKAVGGDSPNVVEKAPDVTSATKLAQDAASNEEIPDGAKKTPDLTDLLPVPQKAEGILGFTERPKGRPNLIPDSEDTGSARGPFADDERSSPTGESETPKISKNAEVNVPSPGVGPRNTTGNVKNGILKNASVPVDQKSSNGLLNTEEDMQYFDNMGKPAYIERSIEIPFEQPPRQQSVVHSPPTPSKPNFGNIVNNLGDVNDLPSTGDLLSTDELQDVPGDPPEEVLDPSVHLPSAEISAIPKIPKIAPIGATQPPNLSELAQGLRGKRVDDVGNVVDDSGNVLGHVMGDLPSMIGKKVAENGEVHGDDGELIGYVTENFIESPSTTENSSGPWGGLQIDHDGNILDATGNVIGRFFQKPGEKDQLPPSASNPQQDPKLDQDRKKEEKPKVNAHTGGSPSDIFLDVKSTTDGIQLTIRIPTTFSKQQQNS